MKLVGVTFLGISAVSGFTLPFLKKFEKQPEQVKYDDDFSRAFDQMDQALKRAFAIPLFNPVPILEADVYHMPDGNEFMTPLRQANSFSQLFGFNPLSRPYYPSSSERFIKLGDTDDQEEQSHDDINHSTTTKHKITQNMMDRLTGKSGLKTTKTTDIVSDDGHSQVHMVVSSFDMDGEENENEKQAEKEEIEMGNKEYRKVFKKQNTLFFEILLLF